jgi:hypothetical protein
MLVFTGSRERTESEYQDLLHRAGLTPVLGADGHAAIVATACNKELYRVIDGDPRPQRGDTRGATSAAGSAMIGTPLDSAVMRRPHRIIQAGLQGTLTLACGRSTTCRF